MATVATQAQAPAPVTVTLVRYRETPGKVVYTTTPEDKHVSPVSEIYVSRAIAGDATVCTLSISLSGSDAATVASLREAQATREAKRAEELEAKRLFAEFMASRKASQ